MGQSTDGILAFGVPLEDGESPWADAGFDEFEDWVMDASGIKEPPAPKDWNNRTEAEKKVWSSFWVAKREALEEFGVTLENYCSGDYPMWALVATGSVTTANRGCPRDIDVDKILRDTDGHREAFQRGCEKLGLRLPGEPRWLLMSYWSY